MFLPRQVKVRSVRGHADDKSERRHSQVLTACEDGKTSSSKRDPVDLQFVRRPAEESATTSFIRSNELSYHCHSESPNSEETEVKQYSNEQRAPLEDEPSCVICGRYGEYICNETNVDVCSMECKAKNIVLSGYDKRYQNLDKESTEVSKEIDIQQETLPSGVDNIQDLYQNSMVYNVHEAVKSLSHKQVKLLQQRFGINDSCAPEAAKKPIYEFTHCNLSPELMANLNKKDYKTPLPVQMQVIPYALELKNLIVCSAVGSGKTLSFLLPLISRIHAFISAFGDTCYNTDHNKVSRPLGVILVPTRELASQIEDEAKLLAKGLKRIKTALLIGGMPLPPQIYRLQQDIQIIIATPGRLCDILILDDSPVTLNLVQTLIIDEVDCMLKMGFGSQIERIQTHLPKKKQVMMFSATVPPTVERLSLGLAEDIISIFVSSPNTLPMDLKHTVIWAEENSKKKVLFQILDNEKYFNPPVLIFVESRMGADLLAEAINKVSRRTSVSLHGDKTQKERFDILRLLEDGEHEIVVTTGVLGRGLDLVHINQVIHFDFAKSLDEFIHRSGRAGRLGKQGLVISFINNSNKEILLDFYDYLKSVNARIPAELEHSPFIDKTKRTNKCNKRPNKKIRSEVRHRKESSSLLSLLRDRCK